LNRFASNQRHQLGMRTIVHALAGSIWKAWIGLFLLRLLQKPEGANQSPTTFIKHYFSAAYRPVAQSPLPRSKEPRPDHERFPGLG
jgi:hypothetical protein